jgi:hypothetical protein
MATQFTTVIALGRMPIRMIGAVTSGLRYDLDQRFVSQWHEANQVRRLRSPREIALLGIGIGRDAL